MKLSRDELFESDASVIVVTTNGTLNRKNEIVMGRGAARQLAMYWPDAPAYFADRLINTVPRLGPYLLYGFSDMLVYAPETSELAGIKIGLFQVKYHFSQKADLALIGYSAVKLQLWLQAYPLLTVAMNFPGIGFGGLKREVVLPLLTGLPDRVTLHENS